MRIRRRSARLGAKRALLLAALLTVPASAPRADPLETIRQAFRSSSQGLTSGIGKGTYRYYRAIGDDEWQLSRDADVSTYFDGQKYNLELVFHRDDDRNEDARRIIYDGRDIMGCYLASDVEAYFKYKPAAHGGRVYAKRPEMTGFPWDIAHLAGTAWNPELVISKLAPQRFEIRQTAEGDLVGNYPVLNADRARVHFECPHRFGFNLARMKVLEEGQPAAVYETRIEWKKSPSGLWHIRSLDVTRSHRDHRNGAWRSRDVLKYTQFEPNANVDPKLFTKDARLPTSSRQEIDDRPEVEDSDRHRRRQPGRTPNPGDE
jgi:hypothetical protein